MYPDDWSEAIIQPLFKKGDPDIPDNYGGIFLSSICGNLYNELTNGRETMRKIQTSAFDTLCRRRVKENRQT